MPISPRPAPKTARTSFDDFNFSMIASMPPAKFLRLLQIIPDHLGSYLHDIWTLYARSDQLPPPEPWLIWLVLGGRGAGKTRTGAEWIREQVHVGDKRRIALVGPTLSDAREVMLEGESGLLNIGYPQERPKFIASRRRLEWPNGAIGQIFTAEDPEGLRGPQFDCAWADEFCAWTYAEETLSNLRLGLRLGDQPQLVITTTPRPTKALLALLDMEGVSSTRSRTQDNQQFLAPTFLTAMKAAYDGTRIGRQELNGDILQDYEGALWSRAGLEACQIAEVPQLEKVIVAVDPPTTSGKKSDKCGIIIAGRTRTDRGHRIVSRAVILHDATLERASPERWAKAAVDSVRHWQADYILVEVNQGGDMVRSVLDAVDPTVCVKTVFATRSKTIRAEPVAALYEQGRVKHVGRFHELEDELCSFGSRLGKKPKSPDRADALVWAVTDLLLKSAQNPRIRKL